MATTGAVNEAMEDLQAELDVALQRIQELEEALTASGTGDLVRKAQLNEEALHAADGRLTRMQDEMDRLREANEGLQDRALQADTQRREAARLRQEAADTAQRLETTIARLTDELARERARSTETAAAGARAARDRASHNDELERAVLEAAELRDEVHGLHEELEAYREAVQELKGQLDEAAEAQEALQSALTAANGRIAELTGQVHESGAGIEALRLTIEERNGTIGDLQRQVEETGAKAASDVRAAHERTGAAERSIVVLQAELKAVKDATRVQELESALAAVKATLADVTAQRDATATLLTASNEQLEAALAEADELRDGQEAAVAEAVAAERKRASQTAAALVEERYATDEERKRLKELSDQKADVEKALAEARGRLAAYEAGYGLADAVKEQEQLREAIRRRDADIARLTATAAQQMDAYDMCEEIARRLAERCGLGHDVDIWTLYTDADLRATIQGTVERLRSANLELMRQNAALEEQRTMQLRQLRVHAEQMGEKGLKYYGLTAKQLVLANEFAENLRAGTVTLPVNDRTLELQEDVRRITNQLKDCQEQLFAARADAQAAALEHQQQLQRLKDAAAAAATSSAPAPVTIIASGGPSAAPGSLTPDQAETLRSELQAARTAQSKAEGEAAALRVQLAAQEATSAAGDFATRSLQAQQGDLRAMVTRMEGENERLRGDIAELAASQERRFEQLKRERDEELRAMRDAEVTRMAALRNAAAASGARRPAFLSGDTDDALAATYALLREKLDSGAPLEASEMAMLYRAFAQLIANAEDLTQQLSAAEGACSSARDEAAGVGAQLAELKAVYERQSGEFNGLVRAHAALQAQVQQRPKPAPATDSESSGPRTPGGAALLRRLLASSTASAAAASRRAGDSNTAAAAEEWQADAVAYQAALVEAVEDLQQRDAELRRYETLIKRYNDQLGALAAQHTQLYRSYAQERGAWETTLAEARQREQEALAKAEGLQAKAQRLDEMTAALGGGAAADDGSAVGAAAALARSTSSSVGGASLTVLADHCKQLTRQVAALEVTQPLLARKYNLLKSQLATARAAARTAELTVLESESHLRQRVLYLELWKKGAEARLARLTLMAATWVPGSDHDALLANFQDLQHRYTDLLASEGSLRARVTELRDAPLTLSKRDGELAALRATLLETQDRLTLASEAADNARAALEALALSPTTGTGTGTLAATGVLAQATKAELLVALTKQRHACGEAEVAAAAGEKRCAILSERVAALEAQLLDACKRAAHAEDVLAEARSAAAAAETAAAEATRAAQGAMPAAEAEGLKRRIAALEDEKDALSREVHKARELADIATHQATAASGLVKDREAEVADLMEQVRTLAGRSDDDAIIGKLQSALLAAKGNFHAFLHKHDTLRLALSRTRVAMLALEVAVDQRAGEALAVREDARVKQLALQKAADDLATQLRSVGRDGFTLAQATVFNEQVNRLAAAVSAQSKELQAAHAARDAAVDEAAAKALQVASLEGLTADLQALVAAAGMTASLGSSSSSSSSALASSFMPLATGSGQQAGAARGGFSATAGTGSGGSGGVSESREVVRRLVELHEALRKERLAAMRTHRALASCRDDLALSQKRQADAEAAVGRLEERMVMQDADARRREEELRRLLRTGGSGSGGAAAAPGGAGGDDGMDGGTGGGDDASGWSPFTLPPPETIEEAHEQIGIMRAHATSLRRALAKAQSAGRTAALRARVRRRRVIFLEALMRDAGMPVPASDSSAGAGDAGAASGTFHPAASGAGGAARVQDATGTVPVDSGFATDDADLWLGAGAAALGFRVDDHEATRGGDAAGAGGAAGGRGHGSDRAWEVRDRDDDDGDDDDGSGRGAGAAITPARLRVHYEAELASLQSAAASTIGQLRSLLDSKSRTIAEYQDKLAALRREREAERMTEASERDRIAALAHEEQQATIERLRAALRDLQDAPPALGAAAVNQQLLDRAESLETTMLQRTRQVTELETAVGTLRDALLAAQERAAAAGARVEQLEAEAVGLRARAADVDKTVAVKESSHASALAELRAQITTRDRKLKALQASLAALKEEFVRAEEEHAAAFAQLQASAMARGAVATIRQSGSVRRSADHDATAAADTSSASAGAASTGGGASEESNATLQARVQTLMDALGRMRTEVTALKGRETAAERSRDALAREADALRAENAAAKAAASRTDDVVAKLRTENQRLQHELEATNARAATLGQKLDAARAAAAAAGPGGGSTSSPASSAASSPVEPGTSSAAAAGADVAALMRRIRVLEAQNAALQEAGEEAAAAAAAAATSAAAHPVAAMQPPVPPPAGSSMLPALPGRLTRAASSFSLLGAGARPPIVATVDGASPSVAGMAAGEAAAASERIRLLLETERKLRKRVEALTAKLNEKTRECEAAKESEASATAALARVKAERDALDKRVQTMFKKQSSLDVATASALAELEPVSVLKARIHELEEALGAMRLKAEAELPAEIGRVRAQLEGELKRAAAAEVDAAEARDRLRDLQRKVSGSGAAGGDGASAGASSGADDTMLQEDRYLAEEALRSKLAESRRTVASVEAALLARDATVMELQFEVEAARQATDRLRNTVAELTAFATIANRGKAPQATALAAAGAAVRAEAAAAAEAAVGAGASRRPATAGAAGAGGAGATAGGAISKGRREAELEDLVTALRRVSDKQKLDIERLRKRAEKAEEDAASVKAAAPASGSGTGGLAPAASSRTNSSLAEGVPASEAAETVRQLRATRAEASKLREKVTALEGSNARLNAEITALTAASAEAVELRGKVGDLEAQLAVAHARVKHLAGGPGGAASGGEVRDLQDRVAALQRENADMKATVASLQQQAAALQIDKAALQAENKDLKEDLSAFDASFFEEVEDLKWRYAEAVKKCRAFDEYVKRFPPPPVAA